ncbi:MAG TPA: hypothetical protein VJ964_10280 [Balneolaceae bacterium]|nr:hypothetical protein [Balneolaceae bacterium]
MSTRKKIFVVLLVLIQLGLIWPVYSFFSGIYPMILGLPLSFAWVVLMLLCGFFLLLWYYLTDPDRKSHSQQKTDH